MKPKDLYTTSQYLESLVGLDEFFRTTDEADRDAQWLVDFYRKNGEEKEKPKIYRVTFERVVGS